MPPRGVRAEPSVRGCANAAAQGSGTSSRRSAGGVGWSWSLSAEALSLPLAPEGPIASAFGGRLRGGDRAGGRALQVLGLAAPGRLALARPPGSVVRVGAPPGWGMTACGARSTSAVRLPGKRQTWAESRSWCRRIGDARRHARGLRGRAQGIRIEPCYRHLGGQGDPVKGASRGTLAYSGSASVEGASRALPTGITARRLINGSSDPRYQYR